LKKTSNFLPRIILPFSFLAIVSLAFHHDLSLLLKGVTFSMMDTISPT
uniref:NADH dehydrogenase subunit 5 n=1 Tax=Brugia timori TaxID=42155 RepID=A0A0R3QH84_9BILA